MFIGFVRIHLGQVAYERLIKFSHQIFCFVINLKIQ